MDIRIRTANVANAAGIARVHVESWRSTYASAVSDNFLASLSYRDRESGWINVLSKNPNPDRVVVAETGKREIIGFASGGPEREGNQAYRGKLYVNYLLDKSQSQGIGRKLTSAIAHGLLDDGIASMLVWVLEENLPARRFYEALGGEPVGQKNITIGEQELPEISYGWADIIKLAVGSTK